MPSEELKSGGKDGDDSSFATNPKMSRLGKDEDPAMLADVTEKEDEGPAMSADVSSRGPL